MGLKKAQVQRLVDMLPPSVETLVLEGDTSAGALMFMFSNIPELKEERLPNLSWISFYTPFNLDKAMIRACEKIGHIVLCPGSVSIDLQCDD